MNDFLRLFSSFSFISESPAVIYVGKIPDPIMAELDDMVNACRQIKESEFSSLFEHINAGQNTYQCSIPSRIFEGSLSHAFIISACEMMVSQILNVDLRMIRDARNLEIFKYNGHHSGHDIWVNFTNKGDVNPIHTHTGVFSGVIYMSGLENSCTSFANGLSFAGERGDIILFDSSLAHWVDERTDNSERITIAFNVTNRH